MQLEHFAATFQVSIWCQKMAQILLLSLIALYLGMQVDTQLSFKEFIEYYCDDALG